jgi:hypothetical protein
MDSRSELHAGAAAALTLYFLVAVFDQPFAFAILAGLLFGFGHDAPAYFNADLKARLSTFLAARQLQLQASSDFEHSRPYL